MATAVESSSGPPACLGCGEPMSGKYVNALDGYWHMACFKCADCGDLVASKFYEFLGKPLCERDHYRRRDLICAQCDQPIKGRSLTALERVFHPEHFVCATCKVVTQTTARHLPQLRTLSFRALSTRRHSSSRSTRRRTSPTAASTTRSSLRRRASAARWPSCDSLWTTAKTTGTSIATRSFR